jgi:hypothetical protein
VSVRRKEPRRPVVSGDGRGSYSARVDPTLLGRLIDSTGILTIALTKKCGALQSSEQIVANLT